jgi:predicted Zn-dependent protease
VPVAIQTREGPDSVSLAAYQGPGSGAYHFVLVSPPGSPPPVAVDTLFRSFRLLGAEEAATLRPRNIEVIRVPAGETLRTLAARMASDHALDLFLMLNGRSADQPIRPGEPVKIVTFSRR